MRNLFTPLAAQAAGVFSLIGSALVPFSCLGVLSVSLSAAPMIASSSPLSPEGKGEGAFVEASEVFSLAAEPQVPAAARDITIYGCLEFAELLVPRALVIWCRPCDQVCIVILQEGVDDRSVFSVPDAPRDSPIRSFSAGDYSVHRSRAGVGVRVADVKPLSE